MRPRRVSSRKQRPGRDSHQCGLPRHRIARADYHIGGVDERAGIDRRPRQDAVRQSKILDRGDLLRVASQHDADDLCYEQTVRKADSKSGFDEE